jgi:transposase
MRCPKCNIVMDRDVYVASNLATRAKYELEGRPAPACLSQTEVERQRQEKQEKSIKTP